MNRIILLVITGWLALYADETYSKNKKANRLFDQGKYEEALALYEEALLASPEEKKLAVNKGSAQFRLNDFSGAEESYSSALTLEDKKARADALYNIGNVYNVQGDQLASSGNQQAMDKYKAARESYIKALDLRSNDRDAKWNLQITQEKIKQLEQQQKNQDNKDQSKNNQDKNNQQNNKDNKNDNDKNEQKDQQNQNNNQDQQNKKDEQQKQEQQNKQDQDKNQQQQQPQPDKPEKEPAKEEALRLLRQYADDDKELNKPPKQIQAAPGNKPEKDW